MNGRQFFRTLANSGVPASLIAFRAGCKLEKVYQLKACKEVPQHYVEVLNNCLRNCNRRQAQLAS